MAAQQPSTADRAALEALRDRLLALRDDALRRLAEADALDAGLLRIVGDVSAALAALDGAARHGAPSDRGAGRG